MRRIDQLIKASRRSTENNDFTTESGIQDEEFLQYFNDAQEEIHTRIVSLFPAHLSKIVEVDIVQGQEAYDLPSDCFLGERVEMVEYSRSGQARDYYVLKKGEMRERLNGDSGDPSFYIRMSGKIYLQPKPQAGGKLRINYQYALPYLDVNRGQIAAVSTSGQTITSLTLDTLVNLDSETLMDYGYLTVIDRDGNVKMKEVPIDSVNQSNGSVIVTSGFEFDSDESIAVGDYVVAGKYSTTVSKLKSVFEKYLLEYVNTRISIRDSSNDSQAIAAIMTKIEDTIVKAYSEPDGDVTRVPIIDSNFIGWDHGDY